MLRTSKTLLLVLLLAGGASAQSIPTGTSGPGRPSTQAPVLPQDCRPAWESELFHPVTPSSEHHFGAAVAVEGDLAAIAAPRDSDLASSSGAVYVYRRVAGLWGFEAKLYSSTPNSGGLFGYALDIDAGRIAVSAPGENSGYYGDEGVVRVFERNGSTWLETAFIEQPPLTTEVAGFGVDIDLDGDALAVGHYPKIFTVGTFGGVHIYRWNSACNDPSGGPWCVEASLFASDSQAMGESVALDGEVLVAGSASYIPGETEAAYVFRRNAGTWQEEARLSSPYGPANDQFGQRVVLDGNWIVVAAPARGVPTPGVGEVYAFRHDGYGWVLDEVIPHPPPVLGVNDAFGSGLALVGKTLVVGSPGEDATTTDDGSIHVFRRTDSGWLWVERLVPSTAEDCDFLGSAVASDGESLVAGGVQYANSNYYCNIHEFTPGRAHVFGFPCPDLGVLVPTGLERVSVSSAGAQGDGLSIGPDVSGDGRWVAFESDATLVDGDGNGQRDVFVRDLATGSTELVSVTAGGVQGNLSSQTPALSQDGRYVVFMSQATNFDSGDTNGVRDIYRCDRQTGALLRVSVGSNGESANWGCFNPSVSADGDVIVFHSGSTSLVPGDANGGWYDVFVRDLSSGQTKILSLSTNGQQGDGSSEYARISPDGRWVVFHSGAVLDAADTHSGYDVYLHDRQSATTTLVSRSTGGAAGDGNSMSSSVSANGRLVVFRSYATNFGCPHGATDDLYLRDMLTGETRCISPTPGAQYPDISACGRWITYFANHGPNQVPPDTNSAYDVFLHDLQLGTTRRLSLSNEGDEGDDDSKYPRLSATGSTVAFDSTAENLTPFDTNSLRDAFASSRALHPYGLAGSAFGGQAMHISVSGTPSAELSLPFQIDLAPLPPGLAGSLRYGFEPWFESTGPAGSLLVANPSTEVAVSADASGRFRVDFNAWIQSGADPELVAGRRVFVQYAFTDPGSGLCYTDGLEFTIAP
jgi:Tol biopolymer transport system component